MHKITRFILIVFVLVSFCASPLTGVRALVTVPTPLSPSGIISDTTPSFTFTKITGATQYRFQLIKAGITPIYTQTLLATACGASSNCIHTPANVLATGAYAWKVQAFVGGIWNAYSALKIFTLTTIPTPLSPAGTLSTTKPTYTFTRIPGATQYQIQLLKGVTQIYAPILLTANCGATVNCVTTPTTVLALNSYTWKVRAMISGVWYPYSPVKAFTLIVAIPGVMVPVPVGSFPMGCDPNHNLGYSCFSNEFLHTVYLNAFQIDKYLVTNFLYAQCVAAGKCTAPFDFSSSTRPSYYNNPTYANYPVVNVNWNQAKGYCTWSGKRLPTEAEWEKASRGPLIRAFPWGDAAPTCALANLYYGSYCVGDTSQVGSYPLGASPYGALDMAGNVSEWVNDWYSGTYYNTSPGSNPPGPITGIDKVVRGGAWFLDGLNLRSAVRAISQPTDASSGLGFRCAK